MDRNTYNSIRADLDYALRQLRRFGEVGRALDALERIETTLSQCAPVAVVPTEEELQGMAELAKFQPHDTHGAALAAEACHGPTDCPTGWDHV